MLLGELVAHHLLGLSGVVVARRQAPDGDAGVTYEVALAQGKALWRQPSTSLLPAGDIFTAPPTTPTTRIAEAPQAPPVLKRERGRKQPPEEGHQLREALAPYISLGLPGNLPGPLSQQLQ
ncbi:MAG: hypothetical protein ACJ797_17445 [Ktedonobacteraceae bacterium]